MRKAYDSIDRSLAFVKLHDLGIRGRMYEALTSIYKDVKCCVRLNGWSTDWFAVNCGFKQGCNMSPILFNLYVNDIVSSIASLDVGVYID
jgi:hypothetical protein